MNPTILQLPALHLIGPSAHFISAMSPDANNAQIIPPLWHQLITRKAEIGTPLDKYAYGACHCLPASQRKRDDELEYLAGFNVAAGTAAPKGMTTWKVAASTYALFTHRGSLDKLCETINYAHGAWLPRSGYEYVANGIELERYDERFDITGKNSEIDYLISIKPKTG